MPTFRIEPTTRFPRPAGGNGDGSILDFLPPVATKRLGSDGKGLPVDRRPGELPAWGRQDLQRSGITGDAAEHFGIIGMSEPRALARLLNRDPEWVRRQHFGRGLVFTYFDMRGNATSYGRFKPEHPRRDEDGRVIRYEAPLGIPPAAYLPPSGYNNFIGDARHPLIVVEGEKKAIAGLIRSLPCIGLAGVWSWQKKRDCDERGVKVGERKLIDDLESLPWKNRDVFVAFDSDVAEKPDVQNAERELARALIVKGAKVRALRLPAGKGGAKVGLDDFLRTHSVADFWRLPTIDPLAKVAGQKSVSGEAPAPWPAPVDGGKLLRELEKFLRRYVVLREAEVLIVSAWVMASWCVGHFDRFAHLAITSPAKRCGKTRLLQALSLVCPRATFSPSISPAVLFRLIQKEHPTFLLDEAQMITRRGSESAEVLRELLNSGIDKEARAYRCGGPNRDEVQSFSVYGPKIVALIGELDEVLADRCIAIRMERKSKKDQVQAFRSRVAEAEALPIARKLARWSHDHGEKLGSIYDELEPFALANDRLAELLLPLQSVLKVADKTRLPELRSFAKGLDAADIAAESAGVRLLAALREIFTKANGFLPTSEVIHKLCERLEEPWGRWTHGSRITSEALARLLRPFGIRPHHSQDKSTRGYYCTDFTDVFARYLSPSPIPGKTRPSRPTRPKRKRRK